MGEFVIAAYRPKPGREQRLLEVVKEHVPILRREGLATSRSPCVMRARDGTILEVFEWTSREAIDRAHANPAVQALWKRFDDASEHAKLADLDECRGLFASFTPVDV